MGDQINIGIFCKQKPPISQKVLGEMVGWLREKNCKVLMAQDTASIIGETSTCLNSEIPAHSQFIVVLGGDGTLLRVAHLTHLFEVPILAVNLGGLGFLAETSLPELYGMLERILRNDFSIDRRMLLNAVLWRQEKKVGEYPLLNDVVINKAALARIVNLEVHVNNQYMTSYRADGLIIATPTGSTAYSLSAGGPIIHPSMQALVLSPICPFTLTNRPIVIPDRSLIKVRLTTEKENVQCTFDGQTGCEMLMGDTLEIQKAPTHLKLIQAENKNYYNTLRRKLHWGKPVQDSRPETGEPTLNPDSAAD